MLTKFLIAAPANYCAPDYDLGGPSFRASSDLVELSRTCLDMDIRLISDTVMAFGYDSYVRINFPQFHIVPLAEPDNPDSWQSSRDNQMRDGYGGSLWRYETAIETYDPQTGNITNLVPAWAFHRTHLAHWMSLFHLAGLRLDSLNNVANWDFIAQFRSDAIAHFADLYPSSENDTGDRAARFLVIGEELALPLEMIKRPNPSVDSLWNQQFQTRVRGAIIGQGVDDNFEWTVRKMIDCRELQLDGGQFTDGTQSVNYITSHDVEGAVRLYNYLDGYGISDADKEQRSKLAFACLLTAVGIPMLLAGDEFCDKSDKPSTFPYKEEDPINWNRKNDPWRLRIFNCVARLIDLRKRSRALGVNDTSFIHFDFSNGRRIVAWVRGNQTDTLVVTVANFSFVQITSSQYIVNNWPNTPAGMKWRNIMQEGSPTVENAGQVPLGAWDAQVYELFRP